MFHNNELKTNQFDILDTYRFNLKKIDFKLYLRIFLNVKIQQQQQKKVIVLMTQI